MDFSFETLATRFLPMPSACSDTTCTTTTATAFRGCSDTTCTTTTAQASCGNTTCTTTTATGRRPSTKRSNVAAFEAELAALAK